MKRPTSPGFHDSEPIGPVRRQSIIGAVRRDGAYRGSVDGHRFEITEVTNPRHCIAWRLRVRGKWKAGYAATVDEARNRINDLLALEPLSKPAAPLQASLFDD
jgi:hypothetical protein